MTTIKKGKLDGSLNLFLATASGGCAANCGGSPTNVSGFGTVSEIHFEKITGVILISESHG
jgi:hypothetical protein